MTGFLLNYGVFGVLFLAFAVWFSVRRIRQVNSVSAGGLGTSVALAGAVVGATVRAFFVSVLLALVLYVGFVVLFSL